ncbi:hypothetical protein B0J13DRAFT_635427 [Dactylonectria estremocensis]|uniref:Uncharacterized protein n=1 Tax=Dactylonectria estremocensis TaxID=1079267 RepID=A0A9P9J565_9HYPO|nr:hypothetical protein B0J13DRAFT_635427 [Dactylonectria estremocensis]
MVEDSVGTDVRREIKCFAQDTRRQSHEILQQLLLSPPTESLDSLLKRGEISGWATHDTGVYLLCNEFVRHIERVDGLQDTRYLSKPSGPLRTPFTCVWAYPTYSTKKQMFGHTMDKTNLYLAGQYAKIGPHPTVRTQDRFPVQESHNDKGVPWVMIYPKWRQME